MKVWMGDLMACVCALSLISDAFLGTYGMSLGRLQEGVQTGDSLSLQMTVDDHNIGILRPDPRQLGIILQPKVLDDEVDVDTKTVREQMRKSFQEKLSPPSNPENLKLTVDDDKVIIIPSEDKLNSNSKLGTQIVILSNLPKDKDLNSHVDTNERRKLIKEYFEAKDGFYSKNEKVLPNLQMNKKYDFEDERSPNEMLMNDMLKSKNDAVDIISQNTDRPAENLLVEDELETKNVHPTKNEEKNYGDAIDEFVEHNSQFESVSLKREPDISQSDDTLDLKIPPLNTKSSKNEDVGGSMDHSHTTQFESPTLESDVLHSDDTVDFEIQNGSLNTQSLDNLVEGSGSMDETAVSGRFLTVFSEDSRCTTPLGEGGRCKSVSECARKDSMENFSLFLDYVCLRRGTLVGICCPDNSEEEETDEEEEAADIEQFKQPSEGCGLSQKTRIVGGSISVPHEWSWMVALLRRNRFFCGGVILNDRYVLTAAHCVLGIRLKDLSVRLGEYNFEDRTEHQRDISVAEIKRHSMFVTMTFQHDIALLKLKRRIEYSKFIGSICLPERTGRDYSDVKATVVGWGTVSFGGSASPILRQVSIPVWDTSECDKTYALEKINEAFVCAGSPENGEDACQGDSGGPLMTTNRAGRWEVIGIVSWGRRCGDPTYPGVYTNVTNYLEWIQENII